VQLPSKSSPQPRYGCGLRLAQQCIPAAPAIRPGVFGASL